MNVWEKMYLDDKFKGDRKIPSFSSSLLDQIYRSIDEGDGRCADFRAVKKQSKCVMPKNRAAVPAEEEEISTLHRARLIEKWMEKKKIDTQRRQFFLSEIEKKSSNYYEYDPDVMFFSSNSNSSESSSGALSSSDTDSFYGGKFNSSVAAGFMLPKPKPVRTTVAIEKTEKKTKRVDAYSHGSSTEHTPKLSARALKIYRSLKKVKQPISPGGKLASFINNIFTTANLKKAKTSPSSVLTSHNMKTERKPKAEYESTCSSASSFSRSCLSKNSPSTREKLRNGIKRNVTFYPVSETVDEDCRPCEQKKRANKPDEIGRTRKIENELKVHHVNQKSRRSVEEIAREFLRGYHHNERGIPNKNHNVDDQEEDDDDAASYASSDLFELDHLSTTLMGKERYREELPVYETTHVNTNFAIANGFLM